ncbi:hypothetical protein E2C01_064725 [Portunus trituberculatus]|uniref:Uncharacterized protein n=1 Tax=Portunus trituberculatus TaxID=210409 RepID=A0A5B7HKK5_PORTR|nr:hypothetical protein [Portunus trituberculatus]
MDLRMFERFSYLLPELFSKAIQIIRYQTVAACRTRGAKQTDPPKVTTALGKNKSAVSPTETLPWVMSKVAIFI